MFAKYDQAVGYCRSPGLGVTTLQPCRRQARRELIHHQGEASRKSRTSVPGVSLTVSLLGKLALFRPAPAGTRTVCTVRLCPSSSAGGYHDRHSVNLVTRIVSEDRQDGRRALPYEHLSAGRHGAAVVWYRAGQAQQLQTSDGAVGEPIEGGWLPGSSDGRACRVAGFGACSFAGYPPYRYAILSIISVLFERARDVYEYPADDHPECRGDVGPQGRIKIALRATNVTVSRTRVPQIFA